MVHAPVALPRRSPCGSHKMPELVIKVGQQTWYSLNGGGILATAVNRTPARATTIHETTNDVFLA